MQRLLFAWVGRADLKASSDGDVGGLGPIAEAATKLSFDELHLLCNYPDAEVVGYPAWLGSKSPAAVSLHSVKLSGPTQHREIYEAAVATCNRVLAGRADSCEVTFHLSPGTPAMHAVWILIAKTRISAALIESSKERGVVAVAVPFDISAELIPDIVGAQLAELTSGTPPDLAGFKDVIHRSKEMGRVLDQAARVAPWGVPVLIEGESGTGKELLARAIHAASGRKGKFIPINCGAIPSELVESVPYVPTSLETVAPRYLCTDGRRMVPDTCPSHPKFQVAKPPPPRASARGVSPA